MTDSPMASREKTPIRWTRVLRYFFLCLFFLWTVIPLFLMFISAFKVERVAFATPEVGDWQGIARLFIFEPTIEHFYTLFGPKERFLPFLLNSILASTGSALVSVVLGSLAAYGLSRGNIKGEQHLSFWILSVRMVPITVVIVPLYYIFATIGLLGTLVGLILGYTIFNLSFAIWLIRGFFDDVPRSIEEAALVDGDSRWRVFRKVALPLAAPGIAATAILCVLFSWTDLIFAAVIGGGGVKTLPVATMELQTPSEILWGPILTSGLVVVVPMMFLAIIIRKYLVTGLTMGAVRE